MAADLIICGEKVLTPEGVRPASVHVASGKIAHLGARNDGNAEEVFDAGSAWVVPGLVDTHVHVNEPGRTEWEGFATATRAAAAGGVTTIFDMPLNSIPATTDADALETKRNAAAGECYVDVGFWGGVVPGNTGELEAMQAAGVPGFKCFLVPSGVDEFPYVTESDVREALTEIARLDAVLLVHAEVPGPIEAAGSSGDPTAYRTWLESRPTAAEIEAVQMLVRLARDTSGRVHVVHLPCAEAAAIVAGARKEGLKVTAETCPHYLTLAAEQVPARATAFKCAPPIREQHHQDAMWTALGNGVIDMIVTDHSPCPPDMKGEGDFVEAWGGIASLQIGLPVTWTAARERGVDLADVVRWMSRAPARLGALEGRKGTLAPGADADVVVLDPEATFTVKGAQLEHRHPVTPYEGLELYGVTRRTWSRGRLVFADGEVLGTANGELLRT